MTAETMPAVTQADREAGAQIAALQELRDMILAGEADDSSPVQIAVKIRRDAYEAGKLEGARVVHKASIAHLEECYENAKKNGYNDHAQGVCDSVDQLHTLDPETVLRNAAGGEA